MLRPSSASPPAAPSRSAARPKVTTLSSSPLWPRLRPRRRDPRRGAVSSSRATARAPRASSTRSAFAAPEVEALYLPAWDCQPYDRVSPNAAISAQRMTVLARLARARGALERPRVLVDHRQRAGPARAAAEVRRRRRVLGRARQQRRHGGAGAMARRPTASSRVSSVRDVGEFADARRHPRPLSAGRRGADPARFLRRHAGIDPRLRSRDPAQRRAIARARSRAGQRGAADDRVDPPLPPGLCRRIRRAAPRRRALRGGERGAARDRPRALAAAVLRAHGQRCSTMSATRRSCSTRAPRTRRRRASPRSPTITPRGAPRCSEDRRQRRLSAAAARPALSERGRMSRRGSPPGRWRG